MNTNADLRSFETPRDESGETTVARSSSGSTDPRRGGNPDPNRVHPDGRRWRAMVVEDNRSIRESLGGLLVEDGYDVVLSENGREALQRMRRDELVDVVVLDLRMPIMDGWEFRAIQKNDDRLKHIPVVAISADGSAQAVAVSADAYLRKPLDSTELLRTMERLLREREVFVLTQRLQAAERLASLGRLAAGVGHEINNPLAFVVMNLHLAFDRLRSLLQDGPDGSGPIVVREEPAAPLPRADLTDIARMLADAEVGLDRIRQTVQNLQSLTRRSDKERRDQDLDVLIEQSVAMAWNQMVHRARFIDRRQKVPPVCCDGVALGQVFLNLLLNAAQAIPEGNAERHQISIATRTEGQEVVVEIADTGVGILAEDLARIFEPFFTTKPIGAGTGLGLSICRQTVIDHGGDLTIESEPGRGTRVRVRLPASQVALPEVQAAVAPKPIPLAPPEGEPTLARRGRVLLIDDESLIGRVVQAALRQEHDVVWHAHGGDAIALLAAGERFDVVLCDLAMPDVSGPEIYRIIEERWPALGSSVVFMTGGAFTPALQAFAATTTQPVLPKPFNVEELRRLVRDHVRRAQASRVPPRGPEQVTP